MGVVVIVRGTVIIVDPTADLQAAIDDAPDYSTIRLAPGIYTAPDAGGFVIDHPVTIEGAGRPYIWDGIAGVTAWTDGTILRPYASAATSDGAKDSTVLNIVAPAGEVLSNVVIRDLGIEHPYSLPATPATIGTGDGIRFDASASGSQIAQSRVENVAIRLMGRDGIHIRGDAGYGGLDQTTFARLDIVANRRHGVYGKYATDITFSDVLSSGSQRCGMYFEACLNMVFLHCLFNGNGAAFVNDGSATWTGTTFGDWPYYDQAQMYFNGCQRLTLTALDFEEWSGETVASVWTPAAVQTALAFYNCRGGSITGCTTFNADYQHGAIESWLIAFLDSCSGFFVAGNHFSGCDFGVIALTNHANRGITCLSNAISDYETSGNDAPCRVQLPNAGDTSHATPSCGNFALIPMKNAALLESDPVGYQAYAGVQIPVVSATSAVTNGDAPDGLISCAQDEKALRVYQDGGWQTVAAGLVSIDGDVVTYDDEVVSY